MKKYISLFLILILSICMLSACKHKATNLEEMIKTDEEFGNKINTFFEDSSLNANINITENTINLVIDIEEELNGIEVTKENKKILAKSFEDSFEEKDQEFAKVIKNLQDQSGLSDILIRISITYEDKEIWAITYNENGKYTPEDTENSTKEDKKD